MGERSFSGSTLAFLTFKTFNSTKHNKMLTERTKTQKHNRSPLTFSTAHLQCLGCVSVHVSYLEAFHRLVSIIFHVVFMLKRAHTINLTHISVL